SPQMYTFFPYTTLFRSAYRRLLSALRDQGLVDEALREYESVLDLEDAPVELRLEYADYLDLLERHREAKRQYLLAGRYVRDVLGDRKSTRLNYSHVKIS